MFEYQRRFDVRNLGKRREAAYSDSSEVIRVFHDHVAKEVVPSGQVVHGLDLWHLFSMVPESVDQVLGMPSKAHHHQGLEADSQRSWFDLGVKATKDTAVPEPLDAL